MVSSSRGSVGCEWFDGRLGMSRFGCWCCGLMEFWWCDEENGGFCNGRPDGGGCWYGTTNGACSKFGKGC
ncbi:hypothetical protein V6N12_011290 [Hibiscus sabdariffa]|uniref:Uncharacterized protein n=1 Tax=Hibiscus sabdariffa TaxID=183260 RepID=A0ABR1ZGG1_9ROSI